MRPAWSRSTSRTATGAHSTGSPKANKLDLFGKSLTVQPNKGFRESFLTDAGTHLHLLFPLVPGMSPPRSVTPSRARLAMLLQGLWSEPSVAGSWAAAGDTGRTTQRVK